MRNKNSVSMMNLPKAVSSFDNRYKVKRSSILNKPLYTTSNTYKSKEIERNNNLSPHPNEMNIDYFDNKIN